MKSLSITADSRKISTETLFQYLNTPAITDNSVIRVTTHGDILEYEISFKALSTPTITEALCRAVYSYVHTSCRVNCMLQHAKTKREVLSPDDMALLQARIGELNRPIGDPNSKSLDQIRSILNAHQILSIDGLLDFRMQSDKLLWKYTVDMLADDILLEREYESFIKLLRAFLEMQPSKADIVHIFIKNGEIKVCDAQLQPLDTEALREIASDLTCTPVCDDDLSVSLLLALAPESVVVHEDGSEEPTAMNTIRKVFDGRICSIL